MIAFAIAAFGASWAPNALAAPSASETLTTAARRWAESASGAMIASLDARRSAWERAAGDFDPSAGVRAGATSDRSDQTAPAPMIDGAAADDAARGGGSAPAIAAPAAVPPEPSGPVEAAVRGWAMRATDVMAASLTAGRGAWEQARVAPDALETLLISDEPFGPPIPDDADAASDAAIADAIGDTDDEAPAPIDDAPPGAVSEAASGPDAAPKPRRRPGDGDFATADAGVADETGAEPVVEAPPPGPWILSGADPVTRLRGDALREATAADARDEAARRRARSRAGQVAIPALIRRVAEENLDVRIAEERAAAARAAVDLAKAASRPTLDVELVAEAKRDREVAKGHTDTLTTDLLLSSRHTLYDFGAVEADVRRARQGYAQAVEDARAAAEKVAADVLDQLVAVSQADAALDATFANIARLREIQALVTASEAEGAATVADVKRVESRLDAALASKIQLETRRDSAANAFEKIAEAPVDAIDARGLEALAAATPGFDVADLARNPEISALQSEVRSLENRYRATRRSVWPTLSLETTGGYSVAQEGASDETLTGTASLVFQMPLYDGGANAAQRAQVMAQLREARLRLAKRRRELEEEARNSTRFGRTDDEKTDVLEARVAALEKVAALTVDQFAGGQRTVFELLESEADLLAARLEAIAHRHDRMRTSFAQLRLSGLLTERVGGAD